ncbi:MAG: VanZ family protein [Kiritimatiellae bacterium]|nr:VanZ family protein [Kiritimatiellia bacterium]MDW8457479.1 VanZ family protein [Verrucomicrobiota bacterium]
MIEYPPKGSRLGAWAWVFGWSAFIFAIIPFARAIQRISNQWLGEGSLRWISLAVLTVSTAVALYRGVRIFRGRAWLRATAIAGAGAVFWGMAFVGLDSPAEATHFVLYSVLGVLCFRAFAIDGRDGLVYLHAFLAGLLVSVVDESLQWFSPGRYWDLRDVAHNAAAVACVLTALALGFRPPYLRGPIQPKSIRRAAALAASATVLLALCFSNTPQMARRLTSRIPALEPLFDNTHPMTEYGFCYREADGGRFYSRFDPESLRLADTLRGPDVGLLLAEAAQSGFPTNRRMVLAAARDAFLFEALQRLERRNHYWGVLPKYRSDPDNYSFHATIAWRENQFLERYLPRTLEAAGQRWTDETKESLATHIRADPYTSPVGRHLVCAVTLTDVWLIAAGALALCAGFWRMSDRLATGRSHRAG